MNSHMRLPRFTESDLQPELRAFFGHLGGTPPPLRLEDDQSVFDQKNQAKPYHGRYHCNSWPARFPPVPDSKGVYIFFDSRKQGVYVGQTTKESYGRRIGKHINGGAWWLNEHQATYVVCIPFAHAPGLARKFEGYLWGKYDFPGSLSP